MTQTQATLTGGIAIALWSVLALLTVATAPVPPFLLCALSFAVAGVVGLGWIAAGPGFSVLSGVPLRAYLIGTAGLFGFHAFYFSALRLAPPAEAGLISYLWPLFIVLGSGLLPGERLRAAHVAGAAMGFAGAALILGGRMGAGAGPQVLMGYGLAFLCALTWAGYSLASRRLAGVPTAAVAVNCLATAALAALVHLAVETPAWPASPLGWLAVLGLGLGPVGIAFFAWDAGVKRGNIQLLGTLSYAAPLLSTLWLVLAGRAEASPVLLLAAALITLGAGLAAAGGRSRRERPAVRRGP